jgi:outer membrane protein assembly factor BamA
LRHAKPQENGFSGSANPAAPGQTIPPLIHLTFVTLNHSNRKPLRGESRAHAADRVTEFVNTRKYSRLPLISGLALLALLWATASAQAPPAQRTPAQSPQKTPATSPLTQQVLPSYQGQNVVSMELAGRPDINLSEYSSLLVQKEGQPFSIEKVNQTIEALKKSGKFQNVELQVRPEPNGVRVLLILEPAIYFGIFEFPGALSHFSYARLLQVANYPPRGAYNPRDVQDSLDGLQTYLRRTGYFQATVKSELEMHPKIGIVDVIFHVTLNRHAKFGNVDIQGTTPQETTFLRGKAHSILARLHSSAIRPGKTYKLKTLQNATLYLENALTGQGHLAAKVRLIGANYNPETNRADVTFHVEAGPLVHVKVEGAHIWSWDKHSLLPVYAQIGVDSELIQEGSRNLISYFQSKGYFDANVSTQVQQQPSGESIVYQITKGPRHKVAEVAVTGNQRMPKQQLLSHVQVEKAHLFSHGKYSQKLVHNSVDNLENLYKSNGFSSVKVTPVVDTHSNGNVIVTFQVDEGPQDIVEALHIEGNDSLPESQFAPQGLRLAPGKPYSQHLANQDRNHIMARYLELGYLTATFRETARALPNQPHRLEVTYKIYEGPKVRVETVATLGRRRSQQRLIDRLTPEIQAEKPLTENDMFTAESRLYTVPGVFDWAEVDPRRRITTQTDEDVLVKVHEAKPNVITYGFGFEVINRGGSVPSGTVAVPGLPPVGLPSTFKTSEKTFWGPRGTFEYTRNNIRGKASSFSVSGLAGRLDQRGLVSFTDPYFRWTDWTSTLSLTGEHNSENPIFTSREAQAGLQFEHALNRDKTENLFVRYSFSETGLTRLLIPGLVPASDLHVRLSTLSTSFVRDTRDNPLDAHRGNYDTYEVDVNPGALGSNVSFARLVTQTAHYHNIGKGIIWANSLRIGLAAPFAGSHVPISEEFFSGGGSTLRGFPLNGAGPQKTIPACGNPSDPSTCSLITVPVGGKQLVIVNSEFRIPVPFSLPLVNKNLGVVGFYDGGNVFSSIGFHNLGASYTNSIGFGLRYKTPVGPVRIDIGHNLNSQPGIKSTEIFVTLGQAF